MDFYTEPPCYQKLEEKLKELSEQYSFLKLFSIGKSVLGRKLYALGIGNLKSVNLLAGAFHGQEWLTASLLIKFTEELCYSIQSGREFCGMRLQEPFWKNGLLIVPMVNPDGCELALRGPESAKYYRKRVEEMMKRDPRSWQANIRGVDLNHNFDAGFSLCREAERKAGICASCPRRYGGKTPHSEPESRALVNLCRGFDVRCVFAFHSQGEEIFYQYGEHTPFVSRYLASLLSESSGYQLVEAEGMASHGGFKDWFIDRMNRPGFTIEIGRGTNPLPIDDLEPIYQRIKEAMCIMASV